jgi:hypothetical protein
MRTPASKRLLAALLMALALPHADAGGMIICVNADGSRNYEFACGCGHQAGGELSACACDCGDCADSGAETTLRAAPCSCTDFHIAMAARAGQVGPSAPKSTLTAMDTVPADLAAGPAQAAPHRAASRYRFGAPPGRAVQSITILRI